ncbi:MAG: hypothetical protein DRP59_02000 [Spirochaetes bacterium]|nr:MAG: hypothetical protein DRP59_02000 [Spirochaetota bacterium]
MNRLITYSIRIQAFTAVLFLLFNHKNGFVIFCLLPWLVFEILMSGKGVNRENTGLILYAAASVSSFLFLIAWLFSVFLTVLFFYILLSNKSRTALLINSAVLLVILAGSVFLASVVTIVVALVPAVSMGFVFYGAARDRSADMQAEIDAQQSQIDGKNKLLSTLAHELRTPLAVIKTSSEILLEERPGKINPTQKKFLKAVRDNSKRMSRFIDSILASIKIEYAWFRMKKKKQDLRPVIKKVCIDLEPFIKSREQTIKYSYPNLLSKTVIDDNWIQQVLINLIHNASKHIEPGGRIAVTVKENEQCIVVSVSDDGSGIRKDDRPQIFSEFYQGNENPDKQEESFNGVGLGLSIVKNVIEKHGGEVYVGSVPGMGTTLSFTLPKAGE